MPEAALPERLAQEWQDLLDTLPPEQTTSPRWCVESPGARPSSTVALFAELEEVLQAWKELQALATEEYAGRYLTTAWTLKDLLAHLASWAREFRQEVETAARGGAFDYAIPFALSVVGPNQWNQVEVERRKQHTLQETFREFESETRRLQDLVLALPASALLSESAFPLAPSGDPAALWRGSGLQITLMKCMHDRYHLGRIRNWLARVQQQEQSG